MISFFRKSIRLFLYQLKFYFIFPFLFFGCNPSENNEDPYKKPNIIVILTDDLGYGDLGCYGGENIPTPNIDRLASQGIRFTDAHVMCPVCGPSRVSLLTGRYQQKMGVYWNPDLWRQYGWKPPDSIPVLPEMLKNAGYRTCHIGKWNITGNPSEYVDEYYDLMDWKGAYYPDENGVYKGVDSPDFKEEPNGWGPPRPGAEYLTDRLTRHAIEFIERNQENPFFLYLAYNAPHTPLQADSMYMEKFRHLPDEPNRIYAGMVSSIDSNVGKILEDLRSLDLDRNTIVVFTSDNGPAKWSSYTRGWPEDWPLTLIGSAGDLRGHKGQLYEGGHREPFIFYWPEKIDSSGIYRGLTSVMDIYPTIISAAGIPVSDNPFLDGVNLLPYLSGEKTDDPHDTLYWMTHKQAAVRAGEWKLILGADTSLFNLSSDQDESDNISDAYPEITRELIEAWKNWSRPFPTAVSDSLKFSIP